MEAEVTNPKFSIADITSKLSLDSGVVNKHLKRSYNCTFKKHLLSLRIEIVKERLRSSNASEISIAKSCGFKTVDEMEKAFRALTGSTPYRYREENRVA
jgi:transcriptional regulator GlxA family with amidase domain